MSGKPLSLSQKEIDHLKAAPGRTEQVQACADSQEDLMRILYIARGDLKWAVETIPRTFI
ncbi:hypothetical protein MASR2M78_05610 [Treponema sp.]